MSGTVIRMRKGNDGTYGFVMVANKKGVATVYGHISEILVTKNQKVKEGDIIALSGGEPGTDGAGYLSTGPHLHFEVRLMGLQFNPERYLE
jgi:murein DD-endopeptidase MepM/ murein hydrolase activator NlpD